MSKIHIVQFLLNELLISMRQSKKVKGGSFFDSSFLLQVDEELEIMINHRTRVQEGKKKIKAFFEQFAKRKEGNLTFTLELHGFSYSASSKKFASERLNMFHTSIKSILERVSFYLPNHFSFRVVLPDDIRVLELSPDQKEKLYSRLKGI